MSRIGLLGGSFNPVHNGHLLMAQVALEGMKLDKVIFVPAFCSPHKTDHDLAPAKHRLAMVKAVVKGNAAFGVCGEEIRRGGKSYTVDTLRAFKTEGPKARLFLSTPRGFINRMICSANGWCMRSQNPWRKSISFTG